MQNRFWRLRDNSSLRMLAEWVSDEMETEKVFCRVYPDHQRGGKRLTDLSVVLPSGPVEDFVWTWHSECLLQNCVLDLLRRECFTGFEVKPVKARFKKTKEVVPTLWELVVTGWGGLAQPESGVEQIYFCKECKHTRYSSLTDAQQLINETQWDGSDFFMVWPMPRYIFVTERVADCVRDNRLTNVIVERCSNYKSNPAGRDGFTPGQLSYWMPAIRARELGERAGIAEI